MGLLWNLSGAPHVPRRTSERGQPPYKFSPLNKGSTVRVKIDVWLFLYSRHTHCYMCHLGTAWNLRKERKKFIQTSATALPHKNGSGANTTLPRGSGKIGLTDEMTASRGICIKLYEFNFIHSSCTLRHELILWNHFLLYFLPCFCTLHNKPTSHVATFMYTVCSLKY
jgi:hypothetical protein